MLTKRQKIKDKVKSEGEGETERERDGIGPLRLITSTMINAKKIQTEEAT